MAKKTKRRAPKELTRRRLSRVERDQRMQRFLVWGVVTVGVLIVGVLGYGLFVENVLKVREPIAIVGGTPISVAEFQARTRLMRLSVRQQLEYLSAWQQTLDPNDPDTTTYLQHIQSQIRSLEDQLAPESALNLADEVVSQLIQEELVRQECARRGITVPQDEVQRRLELNFGYDRNPATPVPEPTVVSPLTFTLVLTPEPTPTPYPTSTPVSEEEFRRRLNDTLRQIKASEHMLRSWIEASLLTEKLQEQMMAEVPTTADQVKLRFLSVVTETLASDLVVRLEAGEDFEALADELEASGSGSSSEIDWSTKENVELILGAEIAEAVFDMTVGERTRPLPNVDGTRYLIIEVLGHEVRELDEATRQQLGSRAFQAWLEEAKRAVVERRPLDASLVPTEP